MRRAGLLEFHLLEQYCNVQVSCDMHARNFGNEVGVQGFRLTGIHAHACTYRPTPLNSTHMKYRRAAACVKCAHYRLAGGSCKLRCSYCAAAKPVLPRSVLDRARANERGSNMTAACVCGCSTPPCSPGALQRSRFKPLVDDIT